MRGRAGLRAEGWGFSASRPLRLLPEACRELARDPSRRRTERSPHGQAAGPAVLPSECLCPLMGQDAAELLDLVQRMPSTLRAI